MIKLDGARTANQLGADLADPIFRPVPLLNSALQSPRNWVALKLGSYTARTAAAEPGQFAASRCVTKCISNNEVRGLYWLGDALVCLDA